MGNKIARTTQSSEAEYYLHELPSSYNLVFKEIVGRGRFLKSIQCKHDEGLILVKVYFKRGDSIDLREYERRLSQIRKIFLGLDRPHVWPFQFWLETDKAAYLLRQYFFNNLHERLSTRPFLSLIEKKWLAFQLLYAVKQSHENGVCHGDIKCENVLVTSWNWLYLADFASFKPTYIPDDDPSDFSFFFDTGGRRRCYLAPERFYEHGGEAQVAQDVHLRPSMDIFAVGCVIAELFLEGQPLFELSQLLAYRRGQYDPSLILDKIPHTGIRKMILHMIQLDPESRLSAESYLQSYTSIVFPSYFSPFLHDYYSCLNPLDSDTRVAMCQRAFHETLRKMMGKKASGDTSTGLSTLSKSVSSVSTEQNKTKSNLNSTNKSSLDKDGPFELLCGINNLLRDAKQNNHYSDPKSTLKDIPNFAELPQPTFSVSKKNDHPLLRKFTLKDINSIMSEYDSQSDTFGIPYLPLPGDNTNCEGMVLIASLLCSCMRNVKSPHLRRSATLLLKSSSLYIDDEARLQRVLPYVISMLTDPAAIVRCAAIETLCDILPLVRDFPPSDAKIFPEYILPMLSLLPDDSEESVRICYASSISKLALTGYGFLVRSMSMNETGDKVNSAAQLGQLRKSIAEIIHELVMGPKQTPNIRRALLMDIGNLCCFFGRKQSNDFILPILPAFLNDRDEQLRAIFYEKIVYVCFFVGQRSVEEYLLPYIEQALSDTTEAVIVNGLNCLAILCKSGFLRKRILLELIERAFPLLCYPSRWVRRYTVTFIASCSESLGAVDSYVFLAPSITPFLRTKPASLASEKALLSCLKPLVSKKVFNQVLENARGSDMLERQRKIWYNNNSSTMQYADPEIVELTNKGVEETNEKKSSLALSIADGRDPMILSEKKLQFSGLVSPQVNGLNSFICDKSSDGIPLYSFIMDKQAVSKSLNMASSVPTPKLFSGSFSIMNGSRQFHRVVHETESRENDQTALINSKFQEYGINSTNKGNNLISGETNLSSSSSSSDITGLASLSRTPSVPDSGWRPRGVLVAHLQEHRSAVNDISVSTDNSFFVTASDDSTVKVWDSKKLEKDISFRSRLTYSLNGSRALCTTMLKGSAQVIAGACDGKIHLFSVDYISRGLGNIVEKYSGIVDIKKKETGEGAILSLLNYSENGCASNMIMYSTKNCGVHLWDVRTDIDAWTLKAIPEEGYVSSLVTGSCGNWFVSGSSRGVLTLWDLRFLIPVNSWKYSNLSPIEKMCPFIPAMSNSVYNTARPLVYVAAGCNEVSLWNAENGSCHQVLRVANNDIDAEIFDHPPALARPSNNSSSKPDLRRNINPKYRVDDLNDPSPRLPGIRSLLPLPGGDLLTGGTDLKIRRWDHKSPDRAYCVCGPTVKGVGNDNFFDTKSKFGVQVVQETRRRPLTTKLTSKAIIAAAATDSAGAHCDSIISLASVKLTQRHLISSSRDGAIKVWK